MAPKEILGELLAINHAVKQVPIPLKPRMSDTIKELVESGDVGGRGMMLTGFAGLVSSGALSAWIGPTGNIPLMVCILVVCLVSIGLRATAGTSVGGKFETRVLRKKHYLELHHQHKSREACELEAYEVAKAKHDQVMKRLRKRAQPIIEHFNTVNPDKELVLSEKGTEDGGQV